MKIDRLKIVNYKLFQNVMIEMNDSINIFVGENDSGKTTILEALSMALTGKVNGSSITSRLNLDWFNATVRRKFKQSVADGETPELPAIEIEVYFCSPNEDEVAVKKFRGTNNSLHENVEGVKLEIMFDTQYSAAYKQLLSDNKVKDIPIEYYKVNFRSFANPEYYIQTTTKRVACIDTTKKDYGPVLSRFVTGSINEYLSPNDVTELRHAYRANRYEFTENQAVKTLNSRLQESHSFDGRAISLNLRETGIDEWKADMSISLDGIPLENSGFGTQNMFKSEIFLLQNSDVDILIIEEPENNLSFANMSILISKLSESSKKQLFISTHSSFVANKLGLQHLHLVANNSTTPFKALKKDTYDYFLKLPGYNTLRILLANEAILVEGPADELIIQRAYIDNYGKQPIECGIDVVTVDSLAFQRYCELASLICKHLTIVTDNDGNVSAVINRYKKYGDLVTLCVEQDDSLKTLEPSVLAANMDNFEEFRAIIYLGNDIQTRDAKSILNFMRGNKTEWSMRVFTNEKNIVYPQYILKAIGITKESKMIAVRPVQMNNKVIFAAAGNGKTYSICTQARGVVSCGNKCALLISYTNQGVHALESEYKKQNYGVLDEKIVIKSWYSFLLSEFIKPYQCTLKLKDKRGKKEYPVTFPENFVTSIAFYETEPPPRYFNQTHVQYFVNRHGDISPDRTSHLAYLCNEHSGGKVVTRMEEIYSHIFIDELQDYAGWDLEIIRLLFESKIQVSCVGDYKQATYRTNNSPKNRQYRDENIRKYFTALEQRRLCTVSYENTTRRFHQEICDFINTIHNDADSIVFPDPMVNQQEQPDNIGVYLIEPQYLSKYCEYYKPIILRYAKNSKIDFNHECEIINYGGSKGATYNRVLIIPVSTVLPFIKGQSLITSNQTRSKFYVACTRAKHSVAFAVSNPKESKVFRSVEIKVGDIIIPAFKFVTG